MARGEADRGAEVGNLSLELWGLSLENFGQSVESWGRGLRPQQQVWQGERVLALESW